MNIVMFLSDRKFVVSVSNNNTVIFWDSFTKVMLQTLKEYLYWVNAIGFLPNGKFVVFISLNNMIKL